jgi:hypothetical protein
MLTLEMEEVLRYLGDRLGIGHGEVPRRHELRGCPNPVPEELPPHRASENLGQRYRDGVSELALDGAQAASNLVAVREGLQTAELSR